jgi:O-antigen/teichoic acid export membrane protein
MLCGKMILSILTTTLVAFHKVAISNTIEFITSLMVLLITYILRKTTESNIVFIGLINSLIPIILLFTASVIFYNTLLKDYKPAFSFIDFKLSRFLFSKGIQFFLIQLAVMFMFTSNNIIISQLFGPEQVTPFSIINKYFSIPMMGFGIIIMPFWASFADAYFKNDINWVKNMVKKLIYIWLALALCLIIMVLLLPFVLDIWIKRQLEYNQALIWYSALFILISSWSSIFSNFINAVDKIRVQFFGAILLVFINVPLSIFLCKYLNMGIEGIMLSSCICLLPGSILSPYQYHLIINKKAKGIWAK